MARQPNLTNPMRDVLIEHIDGPVALDVPIKSDPLTKNRDLHLRRMTIVHCARLGLLSYDRNISPTKTILTDAGRQVLAAALADYADALSRAHYGLDRLVPGVDLDETEAL